jgi:ABC-type Fe3+ transport system substrate-binding protein
MRTKKETEKEKYPDVIYAQKRGNLDDLGDGGYLETYRDMDRIMDDSNVEHGSEMAVYRLEKIAKVNKSVSIE